MALLAVPVWNTDENNRIGYTEQCLQSFAETVNWSKHRLFISDNGSNEETHKLYEKMLNYLPFTVIKNNINLGTARAVNKCWEFKNENECVGKIDSDMVFITKNWADMLEECLAKDDKMAAIGVKRTDLWEHPEHDNLWFKTYIKYLPHEIGERYYIIEISNHVIGSAIMYNHKFLPKFGYLYQSGFLYGYDDALSSARINSTKDHYNCFLPSIEVSHVDVGGGLYGVWKNEYSGVRMPIYEKLANEYKDGKRSIYHGPNDE